MKAFAAGADVNVSVTVLAVTLDVNAVVGTPFIVTYISELVESKLNSPLVLVV